MKTNETNTPKLASTIPRLEDVRAKRLQMLDEAMEALKASERHWQYNDGGRSDAGFKGMSGDCVTRAIAIATGIPYRKVLSDLTNAQGLYAYTRNTKKAKYLRDSRIYNRDISANNGICKDVARQYMVSIGWEWVSTMKVGSSRRVYLTSDELPSGRLVVNIRRHAVAFINGVVHDTFDSSNNGTSCVYGYFRNAGAQ